jgi:hypothetical protein
MTLEIKMNKNTLKGIVAFTILASLCLFIVLEPSAFMPEVKSSANVPWNEADVSTPKAAIQFTFTSKGAFTTNFPIHAKVEVTFFRHGENDSNVIVQLVNPPHYAFQSPIGNPAYAEMTKLPQTGNPRISETIVEFTYPGEYGYAIYSGASPYFGNMTVAYAGQDEKVIDIAPPETRFGLEMPIRVVGFSIFVVPLTGLILQRALTRKKPKFSDLIGETRNELEKLLLEIGSSKRRKTFQNPNYNFNVFNNYRNELRQKLSIRAFCTLEEAYSQIEKLNRPTNLEDINADAHDLARKKIKEALKSLDAKK